jgi:hypothetical protein
MITRKVLIAALLCVVAQPAVPHSGGTNSAGCHTDRRTGDYHCHTPKSPTPGAVTYCHVIQGERRCGYSRSTCYDLVSNYGGYCRQE